jgi:alkylmercury lyase
MIRNSVGKNVHATSKRGWNACKTKGEDLMTKPNLFALSEGLRIAGIDIPGLGPDAPRLTVALWRLLAAGRPLSQEQVTQTLSRLRMSSEALTSLQGGVEYDGRGNIVGVVGLSLNPTSENRLQIDNQILYTWCAWDALFIPLFLKQPVLVDVQTDPPGEYIRIKLTSEGVESYEPQSTVVSLIVPQPAAIGETFTTEDIWMAFCNHVHFFRSRESASAWFVGRDYEPLLLSIEEGYELGRLRFGDLLKAAEK